MHNEAVKIPLIDEGHFEGLLTAVAKGFHHVPFRYAVRICMIHQCLTGIFIPKDVADFFGAEERFSVFDDDGNFGFAESEGLGEFVCHFHFSVSLTRSSAHSANAVGPNGIRMVSDQLKASDKKYAVAMAGFDITPGDGGMTSGEMYLRGLQLIAEKQIKDDPAVETGNVARLYAEINPDNDGTQGLFKSDAARADTVELARGILAYQQWADSGSIEGAIAAAVGGDVEAYNGKKAVMPKGIKSSAIYSEDLGDLVETQAQEVKKARGTFYVSGLAMTGEELAAKMPKLALQTEKVNSDGSVTYSLMLNGESVFGDDGSLYTFDLVKTKE